MVRDAFASPLFGHFWTSKNDPKPTWCLKSTYKKWLKISQKLQKSTFQKSIFGARPGQKSPRHPTYGPFPGRSTKDRPKWSKMTIFDQNAKNDPFLDHFWLILSMSRGSSRIGDPRDIDKMNQKWSQAQKFLHCPLLTKSGYFGHLPQLPVNFLVIIRESPGTPLSRAVPDDEPRSPTGWSRKTPKIAKFCLHPRRSRRNIHRPPRPSILAESGNPWKLIQDPDYMPPTKFTDLKIGQILAKMIKMTKKPKIDRTSPGLRPVFAKAKTAAK